MPQADLLSECEKLARTIMSRGPLAVRYSMEAINRGLEMGFAEGCALEATLFALLTTTDDMKEGTRAFLEKRKAASNPNGCGKCRTSSVRPRRSWARR